MKARCYPGDERETSETRWWRSGTSEKTPPVEGDNILLGVDGFDSLREVP
jgi:hypothetical protein